MKAPTTNVIATIAHLTTIVQGALLIAVLIWVLVVSERIEVTTTRAVDRVMAQVFQNETSPFQNETSPQPSGLPIRDAHIQAVSRVSREGLTARAVGSAVTLTDALIAWGPDGVVALLRNATSALHTAAHINSTAISSMVQTLIPHVGDLTEDVNAAGRLMGLLYNASSRP